MKKNNLVFILLFCVIGLFIFSGCKNKDEVIHLKDSYNFQESRVLEDTQKETEKSVTIALAEWAPYEFEENGEIKGISVDIVDEAFKRMGYKVTKRILPFSRAIEMLKSGEIDMIPDIKNTAERQEIGVFSKEPIVTTYTALFVKSDSTIEFNGDISALKQYKIGTIRDYTYSEEFDNAVKSKVIKVEEVDDKLQNINKILDNRIDIYIENRLVLLEALKSTNNVDKLKELKPEINQTPVYGWFTKKKNLNEMINQFDKKLVEIKKDGTFERIYKSYIN